MIGATFQYQAVKDQLPCHLKSMLSTHFLCCADLVFCWECWVHGLLVPGVWEESWVLLVKLHLWKRTWAKNVKATQEYLKVLRSKQKVGSTKESSKKIQCPQTHANKSTHNSILFARVNKLFQIIDDKNYYPSWSYHASFLTFTLFREFSLD